MSRFRFHHPLFIVVVLVVEACAEAEDGAPTPTISSVLPDASPPVDGGPPPPPPRDATPQGDAARANGVVLNELSPSKEWIELVNGGTSAVDLSGFSIADIEKDGGAPKLDEAVTVPPGTILSPRAYLVVQGGNPDGGGCPDGGQNYCLLAKFGISNKAGETLFLLDPDGAIVGTLVYPPEAVAKTESYGRLPNGDPNGTFQKTTPTPGATNQP